MKHVLHCLNGIFLLALAGGVVAQKSESYLDRQAKWRAEQEADLKRDRGWLSVAGLYWLKEGDNTIGSSADNQVRLPLAAPPSVGILKLTGDKVRFQVFDGVPLTLDGQKPAPDAEMIADVTGKPTRAAIGAMSFNVIVRGKRIGIRLYDPNCKGRREFTGCKWYPVDPLYVVKAKFTPAAKTETLAITNVLGDVSISPKAGTVTFTLNGVECSLDAEAEDGGQLFLNFSDLTSGDTTYGAGRFLDTGKVENGYVTIDFNQCTNPPCAFTSFATCPLPPKNNHLKIAVLAGEKAYKPAD